MNPNLFMPSKGETLKIRTAKEICDSCTVMRECRAYGLHLATKTDLDGIFGGLTKFERDHQLGKIRRRKPTRLEDNPELRIEYFPCGTVAGYNRHKRDFKRGVGNGPCQSCRDAYAMYHLRKRASRKRRNVA